MPNPTGFVLWLDRSCNTGAPGVIKVRTGREEGGLITRQHGIYVRPRSVTPETLNERQPIVTPRIVLAYADWVEDRREVADRLGRPDLALAPDGEVLAAAYAAWGPTFPAKVAGEYSFALVDRKTGAVVAGRDALGLKKLYRYGSGSRVWIASNLDLLLALLPTVPDLDPSGLRQLIVEGLILGSGRTIYQGIEYLPPAHVLICELPGPQELVPFWQPDTEPLLEYSDNRDYEEHLRTRVVRSVRHALRAPGTIVAELSGGLDSSTVASVAAGLCRSEGMAGKVQALSYTSVDTDLDESEYQKAVSSFHGIVRHTLPIEAFADLPDLSGLSQPVSDGRQPWLLVGQQRMREQLAARVCLNGQGGDLVFNQSFTPHFVADLWREGRWPEWLAALRDWPDGQNGSLWNLLVLSFRNHFPVYKTAPAWLRDLGESEPLALASGLGGRQPIRRRLLTALTKLAAALPDESRLALEPRSPLLTRSVVECALCLPWDQQQLPGRDRVLQRRAFKGILPESVRIRETKGDFSGRMIRSMIELQQFRATGGRWLSELGLIEPKEFTATVERLLHGHAGDSILQTSTAMIVECWLAAHHRKGRSSANGLSSLAMRVVEGDFAVAA